MPSVDSPSRLPGSFERLTVQTHVHTKRKCAMHIPVHLLPQIPILCVLENGQQRRHVQREQPRAILRGGTSVALLLRGVRGQREGRRRKAPDTRLVRDFDAAGEDGEVMLLTEGMGPLRTQTPKQNLFPAHARARINRHLTSLFSSRSSQDMPVFTSSSTLLLKLEPLRPCIAYSLDTHLKAFTASSTLLLKLVLKLASCCWILLNSSFFSPSRDTPASSASRISLVMIVWCASEREDHLSDSRMAFHDW